MAIKTHKLIITFIAQSWIVAALQSILYWVNIRDIFTHVQFGFYNMFWDISAELKGVVKVDRKESIKKSRKHESYEIMLTDVEYELFSIAISDVLDMKLKYDLYFYPRWFFNVMIPAIFILGLLKGFSTGYLVLIAIIFLPINLILKKLSIDKWACSEIMSMIFDKCGKSFGFNKKYHVSSPHILRLIVMFMANNRGMIVKKI